MTTPVHQLVLIFFVFLLWQSATGMAASTAYVTTTQQLDLNHVQFVIVAPPELRARLYEKAMAHFTKAGLPLPAADQSRTATLTLELDPKPLEEACQGKVLYAPSLTLVEPVIIARNSVVLNDITWIHEGKPQIRTPVEPSQFEIDLDALILQFIADYYAGNPLRSAPGTPPSPQTTWDDRSKTSPLVPEAKNLRINQGLKDLHIESLQLSVTAGRSPKLLKIRAVEQLIKSGLSLSTDRRANGAVTLGIELIERSIDGQCPGRVVYEKGVYLVEEVRIARNPRVLIWTDTWLREAVQIVSPVSLQQLESDQNALLREFIRAIQSK
ncbi:hypothetical protein [Petrachloros mirabilis]